MNCPKCGKENPDTNQYCGKCGEALKIITQRSSATPTPLEIEKQHEKINEPHIQAKNDNKIVEYIEYIGWGPFILIIVGLLTSWIPFGIILLIIGVAWAIFKHINLGNIEWNVRMTDNKALKEDDDEDDDDEEDDDEEDEEDDDDEDDDEDDEEDDDDEDDDDEDDDDEDDDSTGRGYVYDAVG